MFFTLRLPLKNIHLIYMGKSTLRSKRKDLTHAGLNKVLSVFIHKASSAAPKIGALQKAYVNECSCFIISSLMSLYPAFASKINPGKLEHLLSKFLRSSCARSKKMKGGTLALRNPRTIGGLSLFAGALMFIYALLVTRASVEQMNQRNPFRKPEYTMLNLVKEEAVMIEITQENLLKWVKHPTMQLSEVTSTLSLKAIQIVGKVTNQYTEGLAQAVSDHCLGESAGTIPEMRNEPFFSEPNVPGPSPQPAPESMPEPGGWASFASQSWSTLTGYASGADQFADRMAKVHLAAVNLFDMPGCIQRVNDIKSQELFDKIRNEHAKLKLDIENWGKKGMNDINLIYSLFFRAMMLLLNGLGFVSLPLLRRRTINGPALNLDRNALPNGPASPNQPNEVLHLPQRVAPLALMPDPEIERMARQRQIQALQEEANEKVRRTLEELVHPAARRAEARSEEHARYQQMLEQQAYEQRMADLNRERIREAYEQEAERRALELMEARRQAESKIPRRRR